MNSCYPELTGHLNLNTALAYAALGDSVNAYSARERAVLAFTESGLDSLAQVAAATPLIVLTDSVDYETFIANSARLISDNIEYLTRRPDQEKKWFTNMFAACCLILIIIFTSSLINKYRKRQHRKERNADLAAINHYISLLDSAISQIENQHAENTTMREEIADLTAARYDVLNAVCDVLFALPDSNRHSDKSFARVTETIKSLGTSNQNITKIEQETNRNFSNIISRLRSELPDLKEEEIRLFLYIVIGFTPRTLSVILDLPLDTVYNRKSYLKRKIKTASTPSRDDFLHHL